MLFRSPDEKKVPDEKKITISKIGWKDKKPIFSNFSPTRLQGVIIHHNGNAFNFVSNGGFLELEFILIRIPEKAYLKLSHIATKSSNISYSPINVVVNKSQIKNGYNPRSPHGGYFEDVWEIDTKKLNIGKNKLFIQLGLDSKTTYWLRGIEIIVEEAQ